MSKQRCVIVTPAPPGSRAGNRNTAVRWAGILRDFDMQAEVTTEWFDGRQDMMIALHAKRSRPAMLAWRDRYPGRPLILALTGTDLYRDIPVDAGAAASRDIADRLVVLQVAALDTLTPEQRFRATVIHQSETPRGPWRPPSRLTRFCVIGHLREEKDPLRAAQALGLLRGTPNLAVVQLGAALEPRWEMEARTLMHADPRYVWKGETPHWQALKLLRDSHALVVSSRMEGGAHVVSEAIVHGVPVLASRIPGNIGLLGEDYPGYFAMEDTAGLADLMRRTHENADFSALLHAAVCARQPLFTPDAEREAWRKLLAGL